MLVGRFLKLISILSIPMLVGCSVPDSIQGYLGNADKKPTVSVNDLSVSEGANGDLVLTLSKPAPKEIILPYTSAATGLATDAADYTTLSGNLTIPVGATTATISVSAQTDSWYEGQEDFEITFTPPSTMKMATVSKVIRIDDAQTLPVVTYTAPTSSVAENVAGGVHPVSLTMSGPAERPVVVNMLPTHIDTENGDYTMGGATATFASNTTTANFNVTIQNDSIYESSEDFKITLQQNSANATIGAQDQHTVTITNDDAPPIVAFAVASSAVAENVAGLQKTITVSLTGQSENPVNVDYRVHLVSPGTATGGGTDYTLSGGTLVIPALTASGVITVNLNDDSVYEGDETVNLEIYNPVGATLGAQTTHLLTIQDNEAMPQVEFNLATSSASESVGTHQVEVNMQNPATNVIELYAIPADASTGATKLNAALVSNGDVNKFEITGDSTKVIYTADQDTENKYEIYSVNMDGTGRTKLNTALPTQGDIVWFKVNGTKVYYLVEYQENNRRELYTVNFDGTSNQQVGFVTKSGESIQDFEFSPLGSVLMYHVKKATDLVSTIFLQPF